MNVDFKKLLAKAAESGVNMSDPEAVTAYIDAHAKDYQVTLPTHNTDGFIYTHGPFSLITDNIISLASQAGSPLLQWLPTSLYTARFERVAHLEWVAPRGFDGSTTYRDWLRTITISDCDFGPTGDWSGFEWQMEGGSFSFQSPTLKKKDWGQRDFPQSPVYTVRGDRAGLIRLETDADWALAKTMNLVEPHMNYIAVYGDRNNSDMEWDGIDQIIRPGYVQARKVGKGTPHFANPLVINGAVLQNVAELITTIRMVLRRQVQRVLDRGWSLSPEDVAIVMPSTMWMYIAEELARSGGYSGLHPLTVAEFEARRDRYMSSRSFVVDGQSYPVLLDPTLGRNVTRNAGGLNETTGVAGDIFILIRRANGEVLLEQQYFNWNALTAPGNDRVFPILNGVARAGWKNVNDSCFQYWVEMEGRIITRMMPLQARINNVFIETLMTNEHESVNYTSPDFFAYDGQRGGQGTSLLTPA